jgi:hypothetical protein
MKATWSCRSWSAHRAYCPEFQPRRRNSTTPSSGSRISLPVHRPGQGRVAVQQRRAVERREQPLVRVHDERVGVLDALVPVPDAGREQAGPTVPAVHVEPQAVLARHGGHASQVVDDAGVGGTPRRHGGRERPGVAVGVDGGPERGAGHPVVRGAHDERVHLQDPQRVDDRGMRVLADRHPPAAPGRARPGPALGCLPGDQQGRQVRGRAPETKHPPADGGRPARSAISLSTRFSAWIAPAAWAQRRVCAAARQGAGRAGRPWPARCARGRGPRPGRRRPCSGQVRKRLSPGPTSRA